MSNLDRTQSGAESGAMRLNSLGDSFACLCSLFNFQSPKKEHNYGISQIR